MVSVIVPIYNTERYLTNCLESIKNQTYADFEVLMIDDGSVDSSNEIARKFESQDSRFHLFFQKNSGVSAARNKGIELAKGEYIQFVDSDDWLEPNMIETLVRNMADYCVDISCCQYDRGKMFLGSAMEVWNQDKVLREFLIHKQINGSLVNKLFTREMIGDIRLDESIKYGEDALFLWKNLLAVNSVVISDEVLYHVTLHDDSASGGGSYKPIRRDCIRVWEEISRDAGKLGQPYEDMAKSQLCNMAFFSFYEMAYYGYDSKEDEILFKKILEQNYRSLMNCGFVSKGVKVLSLFTIKMGLLSKIMIRFKARRRNER